jgi:hypothetical protein
VGLFCRFCAFKVDAARAIKEPMVKSFFIDGGFSRILMGAGFTKIRKKQDIFLA